MNLHANSPSRRPIVISDSQLSTGQASTSVRSDDAESLLRDYLQLIRKVRNQQRARNIALRRIDIEILARHLGWTDDQVLARLADLMGATRRQRATMLAVLSTGAALITVTAAAPAAAETTDNGVLAQTEPLVIVEADEITHTYARDGSAADDRPGDGIAIPRRAPVLAIQAESAAPAHTRAAHDFVPAGEQQAEPGPASVPEAPAAASVPATGPDGAIVAVGQPPIPPPATESGTDTEGNSVAVGQPPVPPVPQPESSVRVDVVEAEVPSAAPTGGIVETALPDPVPPADAATGTGTGTDAEGNTVAVGQPPIPPPATETGTDTDGNTVAVGQPPIPPPAIQTGTDTEGNTVAVGQPPIPPSPDA